MNRKSRMIPSITTAQMVEVDRLMINKYGIDLIQMMENAGRSLAEQARRLMNSAAPNTKILVLCGMGNNGGGGMVAARHLHVWGSSVTVVLVGHKNYLKEVPQHQWNILQSLDMRVVENPASMPKDFMLIIDAMIGYSLQGDPRGTVKKWIYWTNTQGVPILALDTPSGLDTTTGIPGEPCIQASATLTLALPKQGLLTPQASRYVGDLYLADIGVPPELYRFMDLDVPGLFKNECILRIT
jgi:NAD(P)H-hydrate epimerase